MDRNSILAIVLCAIVFLVWDQTYMKGERERLKQIQAEQAAQQATKPVDAPTLTLEEKELNLADALKSDAGRVIIETPKLQGTINLEGARFDDLLMKDVRETADPESPMVRLFRPREMTYAHFLQSGWFVGRDPDVNAVWTADEQAKLTPDTPLTLMRIENGITFERTISVDDAYMFTIVQKATNNSAAALTLTPFGHAVQRNIPEDFKKVFILHEGPISIVDGKLIDMKYDKMLKKKGQKGIIQEEGTSGWLGLTSKDRLAAIIPAQGQHYALDMRNRGKTDKPLYDASIRMDGVELAPGQTTTATFQLYAGEKIVSQLKTYQKPIDEGGLGIPNFDQATDWGVLNFLTRPIFDLLHFFAEKTGNYGIAILLLVLVIKAILYPLANKAFKSTAKMKKLQPQITQLRDRNKGDQQKVQKEMMELYKKEGVNPMAGCWPVLLQMPVFLSLYKVLYVTNEMRHESFLYISDLSSRDPTSVFNLFGLIPYDPMMIPVIGTILGIGLLPLLNGIAMFVQTKLNPPPTDAVQAQVMTMMPIIFTFVFAPFAAGLVLYWFWNSFLGIIQQWVIMKRQGVDVDLFGNMAKSFKREKPEAVAAANDPGPDKTTKKSKKSD